MRINEAGVEDGGGVSVSRRGFLGATGAFGAVAMAPGRASAFVETLVGDEQAEVVVVGGGLAGLSAARALGGAGVDVLVLEADRHVGGRVAQAGSPVAFATATVLESHHAVLALARALGVRTEPAEVAGDSVVTLEGERRVVPPGRLAGDPDLDREAGVVLQRLNLMAAEVDPEAPWVGRNASARDHVTLESWIADHVVDRTCLALLTLIVRAIWAADPAELSLLHALSTIAGAGGVGPLVNAAAAPHWRGPVLVAGDETPGDSCRACRHGRAPLGSVPRAVEPAGRVSIRGGAAALVQGLMRALAGRVRSASPVRSIEQSRDGVTVAGDGFAVRAGHAVVALPPPALASIVLEPGPPPDHGALLRLWGGDAFSVVATYPAGALQHRGLSGWAAAAPGTLTVARAVPDTGSAGVVVASGCGEAARALSRLDADERRRSVETALAAWFGEPPRQIHVLSEDASRGTGGWSVVAPPGAVTSTMRGVRQAHGRVHWAGTERASAWAGWIEGAVRSGEGAAHEVMDGVAERASSAAAVLR